MEAEVDGSPTTTTSETPNSPLKGRALINVVISYEEPVKVMADWIGEVMASYAEKSDAHLEICKRGIISILVPHAQAHQSGMASQIEKEKQNPDYNGQMTLVISCFADGMSREGKSEYMQLHSWCKKNEYCMQVLNGKNRQHNFFTSPSDLPAIGENFVGQVISKMELQIRKQNEAVNRAKKRDVGDVPPPAAGEPIPADNDSDSEVHSPPPATSPEEPIQLTAAPSAGEGQNSDPTPVTPEDGDGRPVSLTGLRAVPDVVQPCPTNEWDAEGSPLYFEKLVGEMKQRLFEGQRECMVKIGVDKAGIPTGLPEKEFATAIATVDRVAKALSANISVVAEKTLKDTNPIRRCAEVLVRHWGEDDYIDLRIAICGNVDSGKSTLVGVLTKGILDNGRGLVRAKVFRHKHEVDTGRTSSISEQLIGFDSVGNIVNYVELKREEEMQHSNKQLTSKELAEKSSKVITFFDLAGHEKYLKTTVLGMTGGMPDYACIVISANNGIQRMTKEHLGLCLALKIPFYCVITRIDSTPEPVMKNTTQNVVKLLKQNGVHKLPFLVRSHEDTVIAAKNIKDDRIAPIFHVSNVTGESLDHLRKFMNLLPVRRDWNSLAKLPAEVVIDSTFYVSGVGTVVGGIVHQGAVRPNDTLLLGPNPSGNFRQCVIKSIHVKQNPVNKAEAGTAACFALKKERRSDVRKGMVLVDVHSKAQAVWEFEAEIVVLYHSTTIQSNYQPVVHIGTVRQSCAITLSDTELLRTGDKAVVRFRFMYKPEYIRVGSKLIFREGRTKGLGTVTNLLTNSESKSS